MFDESVTYEKPPSAPRADRGPLELSVPKFNPVFARTDGHPRLSWTRRAVHHDGEDDSMFDESATYEKVRARSTITAHPGPNTWAA